ncbi:putative ring finger domain-containing protein [Neofusicoccum parvum UCRNP2]|uniref:Ring finger domain-containing protein n=2 Tax=Neofusicoccum parvum TaxID=310453 RepID=A0ACB5SCS2_9PEZI|nr:putative ring finger domain-containing protein [Neofusicoccum parvum UCRNP2]GME34929.1 putative ring finger domain-containing protein [Neofusicoccum parvum]
MAAAAPTGPLMDLEKELSCSICTDVLYQPLTLLDCLHTFCGACLKEWFSWQAQSATSHHPYTCPSCRASVRATQPNATVTTLLDMFLQANPGRGKSDQEKEDMRKIYKPGDNVLPKLRRRRQTSADEEERRMLEEVRQISLQEVGVSNSSGSDTLSPPAQARRRDRSREREERRRRARDTSASRNAQREQPAGSRSTSPRPPRVVEHQSSLRSLLSASDFDSSEMEEEIMRQIREEGLLDGIDLENIDVSQEEEITERIAAAFRRRQRERERARPAARSATDLTNLCVSSQAMARGTKAQTMLCLRLFAVTTVLILAI